ncbi:MAG: exodeoxyribonuclease VII large subunit, partial [Fusobacteriaceae bacterium]|nr:exodeoxyribonuclease VII large subunit [Fusobacteriaceae bacterium]
MREVIYTVSEFNRKVKNYLEDNEELKNFFIEGEMSNVVYYKSGHLYFNIKDEKSQLKCAAFNYKLKRIPEDLKEGDAVKIFADVGFYENRGDFQLLARHIEKKNALGELFVRLEKLKKEMLEKGYFNPEYKKSLPKYPKNIGVVTAITGAAVQDIIKTIKKRDNSINIYIYPAKVQGQGAVDEIVAGIKRLDQIEEIDIIIAGRGGGSIEDLWAFNEREVVMAFFNCKKPIISAVGHEIDFLLSDMVADVRAATPTQAVEICVPEREKT